MAPIRKPETSGTTARATEQRPLTKEPEEPGTMAPYTQPHYNPPGYRVKPNGLYEHDLEVTISAWRQAWIVVKPMISGIVVLAGVLIWNLVHSVWFNAPVATSQLAAVTSEQKITNNDLKTGLDVLTRKTESHDRVLERLATIAGETRAELATIKGYLAGLLQANSPPPAISPPTPFGQFQQSPTPVPPAWQTRSR